MSGFVVRLREYEGPFELLLDLVRRQQLSLTDLPLAPVAAQYLAYMRQAAALDLNLAIEFVHMAARLIAWKAAALLPAELLLPNTEPDLATELRQELTRLDRQQLAQAQAFLQDKATEAGQSFSIPAPASEHQVITEDKAFSSLWTLRQKAQTLRVLFAERRQALDDAYAVSQEQVSLEEMLGWTRKRLHQLTSDTWFSAEVWFTQISSPPRQIALFLALLELARLGELLLEQSSHEAAPLLVSARTG